ncbi:hypothetical protein Gbfr_007_128 [Gluconobacter frateurii M-2]|nr:hypothetical protein Gbfr_007_128 [Gluconobacter frateurii M-2]
MIIFEGDELVVHYHQGNTDYALVTFEGAHETKNATKTFFGAPVVRKLGITCIGVTAKVDHWYISPDTSAVQECILNITKKFSKIVVIGISMGAHTALSWSKILNADTVLAMAPKWSLDPDECPVHQYYLTHNFRDSMKGMGIRKEQLQGRLFVAYDPLDEGDWEQSQLLSRKIPEVKIVNTYYSGHVIIHSLSGSNLFGKVISALAYGSDQDVYSAIAKSRRFNENNLNARLMRTSDRHAGLVAKTLMSPSVMRLQRKQKIFQNEALMGRVLYNLLLSDRVEEAAKFYDTATEIAVFGDTVGNQNTVVYEERFLILSRHGYVLCYNPREKIFCARNVIIQDREGIDVYAVKLTVGLVLAVRINMVETYFSFRDGKIKFTRALDDDHLIRLVPFSQDNEVHKYYAVHTETGYMCSHPDHRITLNAANLSDWERFTLLACMSQGMSEKTRKISDLSICPETQSTVENFPEHSLPSDQNTPTFWQKWRDRLSG